MMRDVRYKTMTTTIMGADKDDGDDDDDYDGDDNGR